MEYIDRIKAEEEKYVEHIRRERALRMQREEWRIERYNREVRLGLTPTDDITKIDAYMQALADVPKQPGFPWDINWPTL